MSFNKSDILDLNAEEKRKLAFELLDSIDEEFAQNVIPDWKRKLIRERIELDKSQPGNTITWNELKKKYRP